MPLAAGTSVGHYSITAPLGGGGMGEVYRARDTKLDREVALKVLPEAFTSDAERLARFEREAKVLGSLNHPHIAAIHGLEDADGKMALVLELVEGPTLADRIAQGPIAVAEALPIARQIAEALEAAHEQGIVHRDLKPANVKVRSDGTVKVLDFGLAKALQPPAGPGDPSISQSPTITAGATGLGVILGTAAYMAPEQARGQPVDRRADIWAFGCVLFEMLTGERPFRGRDVAETMARVLERDPDWSLLPTTAPRRVQRLVRRCLTRDLRTRLQHVGDARIEIEELGDDRSEEGPTARDPRPFSRRAGLLLATIALALAVAAGFWWPRGSATSSEAARPAGFSIELSPQAPLALGQNVPTGMDMRLFDISRDGRQLVYVAEVGGSTQLHLHEIGSFGATPLAGTEGATHPFFSPDGGSVGYITGGSLERMSLSGGRPETVAQGFVWGATWAEEGIYYVTGSGSVVRHVPSDGGPTRDLPSHGREGFSSVWPVSALPGGRGVLATANDFAPMSADSRDIVVWSRETGEWRTLLEGAGYDVRYAASGHLVYVRAGALRAVPFDLDRLEVTGVPTLVLDDVRFDSLWNYTQFALSETGILIYSRGGDAGLGVPTWLDREGNPRATGIESALFHSFSLSPDDRSLAIQRVGAADQIEIYDLETGVGRRLTTEGNNGWPIWATATRLLYVSRVAEAWKLLVRPIDGGGEEIELVQSKTILHPYSWFEDRIAFGEKHPRLVGLLGGALLRFELGEEPVRLPYPQSFQEFGHNFSPDGRWLVYTSLKDGAAEVYVRTFPTTERQYKVSANGGMEARWSPEGDEIIFRRENQFWSRAVTTRPEFSLDGPPRLLFETPFIDTFDGASWDIAADGRILLLRPAENESDPTSIRIVLDWFAELEDLAPVDG